MYKIQGELSELEAREVLLTMIAAGLLIPIKEFAIGVDLIAQKLENPEQVSSEE